MRTSTGLGLFLLLCLVAPFGRADADPLFAPHVEYSTAGFPGSVAIGDLNHDGNPDLVVGCGSGTVSVLLGRFDGSFGLNVNYAALAGVSSVAIGDFDGDGNLDMVATNYNAVFPSASVRLGNGDGTFGLRANFGTVEGPTGVAVGDLTGDGRPDLAVTAGSSTVSVLPGDGHGGFGLRTDLVTGSGPVSVAIGELNHDGVPDLAVANSGSGTVSVLLGKGNGAFWPKADYATAGSPRAVAIGDLDGDGNPDLAVANSGLIAVSVLLGNADGTFKAKKDYPTWCCPASVAIGDLNGDGKPDLVSADASQPNHLVSVLLGIGDGTFAPRVDYVAEDAPFYVAIADLNHDGKPDLVVSDNNVSKVSVLLNVSPTTAVPPAGLPARFALVLAGPNPAHGAVSLAATLPHAARVDVAIYSLQGGLVRRLLAGAALPAGTRPLVWDARDESGARAARGVYFARMRTDGVVTGRTTVVLR